jgi:hypothetical protein
VPASEQITNYMELMIVVGVPEPDVDVVLDAIASAGGGILGTYTHCTYVSGGQGRFLPGEAAHPAVGGKGIVNRVDEARIETFCARTRAKAVVAAIRAAHPYEEPVIYLIPLLAESDL